ncbi:MAG: zinc-ribbon domain-containing protein, partial [Candidatus Deferrimicrobiaceae bacterium]
MIIECQTCHARFRLDESRIKGRGARVKCRKCGNSIVVLKGSAPNPAPPTPGGGDLFDLGSAIRDPTGAPPVSPFQVGNLIPFPAPSRQEESFPPSPFSSAEEGPAPGGKDEVDLAFDRVLFASTEISSPSIAETEAEIPAPAEPGVPGDRETSAGTGSRPGPDLGALTLDLEQEEKLDLPPAADPEPTFGEPPPAEPAAAFHGEGGFLISDSEILDFLKEKHPDAGSEAPPDVGDISLGISSIPVDESRSSLREPDASRTSGDVDLEGNVTPPPAPLVETPPLREATPAPAPTVESAAPPVFPVSESPRRRSVAGPAVAAALAVLAVLLAAGGYLGF